MSWAAALDALEARIAEQRRHLDAGDAGDVPMFVPPPGLGPLPAQLLERARRVLAECDDLVAELEGNVVALKQDLGVAQTVAASARSQSSPRFVDTSA